MACGTWHARPPCKRRLEPTKATHPPPLPSSLPLPSLLLLAVESCTGCCKLHDRYHNSPLVHYIPRPRTCKHRTIATRTASSTVRYLPASPCPLMAANSAWRPYLACLRWLPRPRSRGLMRRLARFGIRGLRAPPRCAPPPTMPPCAQRRS